MPQIRPDGEDGEPVKRRVTMSPDISSSSPPPTSGKRSRSVHIPDWLPDWTRRTFGNYLPYVAILIWYCFNMSVVLSNRWIFTHLPLPTSLTLLHAVTGYAISSVLLVTRPQWSKALGLSSDADPVVRTSNSGESIYTKVMAFLPVAISLTGNNYFSNLSMRYASAPFTQTIKAIVPVVTMVVYYFYAGRQYEVSHYVAMIFVVAGVFIASAAEVSLNYAGLAAGLIASVFTALKVVLSNDRTKKLDPLVTVNTMAPYSFIFLLPVFYTTEYQLALEAWPKLISWFPLLLAHGVLVMVLNLATFFAMAVNSPTTMTCCGNMKVMFVYVLSWLLLGTDLDFLQLVGATFTILGGLCFGMLQEGYRMRLVNGKPTLLDTTCKAE